VPWIEIYGTEGTLSVPDPNGFGGTVRLFTADSGEWREAPVSGYYTGNDRGLGLADMASAIRSGRPHRANGQLAFHVLDIMMGIYDAWEARSFVTLESTCERPQPMPADLKPGQID